MFFKNVRIAICLTLVTTGTTSTYAYAGGTEQEIADFLQVPVSGVHIECPQQTFDFKGSGEGKELKICLLPTDSSKRCEIAIATLKKAPVQYKISFEIKDLSSKPSAYWQSVMQIHSFPDRGESWRCPPFSLETMGGYYRAYSRWDTSPISRTTGNDCAEAGSSIRGREVISGVPILNNHWQQVELGLTLSPYNNGRLSLNINKWKSLRINGGNTFNDVRLPYIKLGIYKPAGWDEEELKASLPVCVSYRNLKVVFSEMR